VGIEIEQSGMEIANAQTMPQAQTVDITPQE
jgi:hypothetical protein